MALNDYTIFMEKSDGTTENVGEWFPLPVAKKILAKAHETREPVTNSPVVAIGIVDYDGNEIAIHRYN